MICAIMDTVCSLREEMFIQLPLKEKKMYYQRRLKVQAGIEYLQSQLSLCKVKLFAKFFFIVAKYFSALRKVNYFLQRHNLH